MTSLAIDRRWLLTGGAAALLGLAGRGAFADVLMSETDSIVRGDGPLASQMRLGELLIRYLARHRSADAADSANVVVSPASLAAILSLVDLGGDRKSVV